MKVFDPRRVFCRGGLAVLLGLSVSLAVAQDDPGKLGTAPFGTPDADSGAEDSSSDSAQLNPGDEPSINLDAPKARKDTIGPYQVRRATTEYMAGRLRVRDPATGEIRGVRPTNVLVLQNGKVVRRTETDVDGVVQIEDLPVGIYAVVAYGPDGAGAFAFEVLPPVTGVSVPSYRFDALIVPVVDLAAAKQPASQPAPVPLGGAPAAPLPVPPIPVATTNQPADEAIAPVPATDQFASNGDVFSPLKGEAILVHSGKVGTGRIMAPSGSGTFVGVGNLTVSFIREGQVLGQVTTDSQGYCNPMGLEAGVYSMVGFGPNGFVAIGFQVKDATAAYSPAASIEEPAAREYVAVLQGGPPVSFGVGGAPPSALPYFPAPNGQGPPLAGPPLPPPPPGFAPGMAGGGAGGFGGGGGGLFGGGGLLGALLGAGAGAGVAALIANDDDDEDGDDDGGDNRPPASPFRP